MNDGRWPKLQIKQFYDIPDILPPSMKNFPISFLMHCIKLYDIVINEHWTWFWKDIQTSSRSSVLWLGCIYEIILGKWIYLIEVNPENKQFPFSKAITICKPIRSIANQINETFRIVIIEVQIDSYKTGSHQFIPKKKGKRKGFPCDKFIIHFPFPWGEKTPKDESRLYK